MGTMILAAASTTNSKSNPAFFIILIVLVGLFYVLMIRPQRNKQRRAMQMQNEVVPGQKIRTTAGLYGTIVSSDDRDIVVEIAPGVQVKMLRRAVMDVLPPDEDVNEADGPDASAAGFGDEQEPQGTPDQEHEALSGDREVKDRNN